MTRATPWFWALALPLAATASLPVGAWGAQVTQTARARVLHDVNGALAVSDSGKFAAARQTLEQSLRACAAGPAGRECRILYASGLGSLLHRQGGVDRRNRDSLYLGAVGYYDLILKEVPDNSEAVYGKALSFRALGPHEWMEPFFSGAPKLDPGRSGLYYTFLGDYYAAGARWSEATGAYKRAVQQDAEDEGARSGLIEALAAQGPQATPELLLFARDWEARYPGSAADAYRAILVGSFGPGGQRDSAADAAVVGLVRAQARNRLTVGEVPTGVSADWTPVREIQAFLRTPEPAAAPWWLERSERQMALTQAALAGGRAAVSDGKYDAAERMWQAGVHLARRSSAASLDLQRELALLYFRRSALDPDGRKFDHLEQEIFSGKMGALAAGDLEAAQRYHTTLGLIYVARGTWRGSYSRNAEQQLTWALDKAEEREQRQGFYQPLPELRQLLARGLDSLGRHGQAARQYAEAATAFLDADDFAAADSAVRDARRLGADPAGQAVVLALRSDLARGGTTAANACAVDRIAAIRGAGNAAFFARQRFKVLADCARVGLATRKREHAIAAFRLVDSVGVTLVGGGDVARFDRVMTALLDPFGIAFQAAHLDPAPVPGGPAIQVSLPGESRPLWDAAALDDVIAARVVAELGAAAEPFPISVSAGVLSVPPTPGVSSRLSIRLKKVAGLRGVRARSY
jgi:tetratricopeptide (TPR) repeat protein